MFERPAESDRIALICQASAGSSGVRDKCCIEVLAGRLWIAGRIRLDARPELVTRLADRVAAADTTSDALLCLHAYAAWGERFVDFLAGDFSFVLWDAQRACLLAVRDQLGIRNLFHATAGGYLFVSDSLRWIASCKPVDRTLDEYWIADFLTLGYCREFERTVYRDVCRLAPGTLLRAVNEAVVSEPYWRLDIGEPLSFRDPGQYAEKFRELLWQSIKDRAQAGTTGISMSGGLDSTSLAAATVDVMADPARVVAEYEHRSDFADLGEERFARLAARHLGIGLNVRQTFPLVYDRQWRSRAILSDEPTELMVRAHWIAQTGRERSARASVWFYGEGPDNALRLDRDAYFGWLLRQGKWRTFGTASLQYARVKGAPGWLQTIRRLGGWRGQGASADPWPPWVDQDMIERLKLQQRAATLGLGGSSHAWHPWAFESFTSPNWQAIFDNFNFEEQLSPIVWRHPYLDLRVLGFMLSVPPVPWGWNKLLVRRAMAGRLPAELLERPKAAPEPPTSPVAGGHEMPPLEAAERLAAFIDPGRLPGRDASRAEFDMALSAHALDYWLATDRGAMQIDGPSFW